MSAIDDLFHHLRAQKQKALMPFITAGDLDLEFTDALLEELGRRGCHLCELGIPYSDPIADGPVIQASYTRALERKQSVAEILSAASIWAPKLEMPLTMMVSYAIVHRHGLETFVARAKQSGFAGLIVPDLLVEESQGLAEVCRHEDLSLIQLVTPTTPRQRAVRIAECSTGFLYYVSVAGITGERRSLPAELVDNVGWLRERTELPICVGFGISQPEHVRLLAPVADGLIVGSAIVRRIAQAHQRSGQRAREEVLDEIGEFVGSLLASLASASE